MKLVIAMWVAFGLAVLAGAYAIDAGLVGPTFRSAGWLVGILWFVGLCALSERRFR